MSAEQGKCFQCRRKLGLIFYHCRCEHDFCMEHRYDFVHKCTYDWKKREQDKLIQANPVVDAAKVINKL